MARRIALALSNTKPWTRCQSSLFDKSGALLPCGLSGLCQGKVQSRAFSQVAMQPEETLPLPTPTAGEKPPRQRKRVPKSPEQWLSPFLEVSTEHAGSVRAVQLLRNLQHVSREHLKNNLTEAFAAISDTMQQIQLEPSTATPTVLQDIGAARNPKQSLQDTPSTIDHVPLLLYNLGRVLQAHKSIDKDMQQQNRTILKRLFEVAATQTQRYTDPVFVAQLAAAQSPLRIYCRTFWKNLHEGLLDSWSPSTAASVIHAYGKMHAVHAAIDGAVAAQTVTQQPASRPDVHSSDGTQPPESGESVVLTTDTIEAQNITPSPSLEMQNSVSSAEAAISPAGQTPRIVDMSLQKFQQAAVHKFAAEMNAYGIGACVASLLKQGMLAGDVIEPLQQGLKRVAADMRTQKLAMTLWAFHSCNLRLGCAEEAVKEALLKPEAVMGKMKPHHAVRTLRVMHHWGWEPGSARGQVLDIIRANVDRFNVSTTVHTLALFAELKAPLEEAHKPLLESLSKEVHRLTTLSGLEDARRGLEWAKQGHVHRELVEAAATVVESTIASVAQHSKGMSSVDEFPSLG